MSDETVLVDVSGLAPGETRCVEAFGRQVLLCNAEGAYFAIENRCPHAAVRLEGGALRGSILECPVHGGRLDVRDGSPQGLPIRRPTTTYRVQQKGDEEVEIRRGPA